MEIPLNNAEKGFYYDATDEQIARHQLHTIEEILYWIEDMNKLLREIQTEDEWNKAYLLKNKPSTYSSKLKELYSI